MARSNSVLGALLGLVLGTSSAHAEPRDVTPESTSATEPRPLELAVGGELLLATRQVCSRDVDVVGCSQKAFRGVSAAVEWRLDQPWSVGLAGALGWSGENDGASHRMSRAFADVRFHPWAPARVEPWLGLLAGFAAATDTLNADQLATGSRSETVFAPMLGPELGMDVGLGPSLALVLVTRVPVSAFPDPRPLGTRQTTDYGTLAWFEASVGLVFRPDFGSERAPSRAGLEIRNRN